MKPSSPFQVAPPPAPNLFCTVSLALTLAAGALGALTGCGSESAASVAERSAPSASGKSSPSVLTGDEASRAALANAPKSIFNLSARRDPFFAVATPPPTPATDGAAPSRMPLVNYLKLVGIRSGTSRPLALINRTTFAPGEEASVSIVVSNQVSQGEVRKVNVKCLEVRRDSVLISIAGEHGIKELRIAQAK